MNSSVALVWRTLCSLSILSLAHCAYSAAQHRSYLRLIGQPFTCLPLDLLFQTIISLLIAMISTAFVVGEFQPIRADFLTSKKSWDTIGNCPSFYIFDHRGKCLLPKFEVDEI
uniref:Membrane magnesium transporter n=1 Tax=Meloidogyne incognita TaxID=6306 RepID=A0A914N347_MELIC